MSPSPEICVGALALRHDHLLMVKRGSDPEKGRWSLPGGRVEFGETIAEAVVRETREETGLEVVCDSMVGWVERISDARHFVIMDFAVSLTGPDDPAGASDASEARWVPLWEVSELDLVEGLLDFLADNRVVTTL